MNDRDFSKKWGSTPRWIKIELDEIAFRFNDRKNIKSFPPSKRKNKLRSLSKNAEALRDDLERYRLLFTDTNTIFDICDALRDLEREAQRSLDHQPENKKLGDIANQLLVPDIVQLYRTLHGGNNPTCSQADDSYDASSGYSGEFVRFTTDILASRKFNAGKLNTDHIETLARQYSNNFRPFLKSRLPQNTDK